MRSIDVHAHLVPKRCLDAFQAGNDWHGVTLGKDDKGINIINNRSQRWRLDGRLQWGPEERICDMDSLGVDMQVVSVYPLLYSYDADVSARHGHRPRDQRRNRLHDFRPARKVLRLGHPAYAGRGTPPSPRWSGPLAPWA